MLEGKHGNAGHAGHMLINERLDALCGCGNVGDVEGTISGRNLGIRAGKGAADIFAAARNGDSAHHALVSDAAQWFGRALYNLTVTLDTRLFVIGGSVWNYHGDWMEPIVRQEINSRLPALTEGVTLRRTALGALVADVGALSLVMPPAWVDRWRRTEPWHVLAA
jgi:glucokinase